MDVRIVGIWIILLLVVGTVVYVGLWRFFYFDLTKRKWAQARDDYPQLARQMNLEYKKGELVTQIGTISGTYETYRVAVEPDDNATIAVHFTSTPDLFISSSGPDYTAPFPGMVQFDTGNRAFDRYFKIRFAAPAIASAFSENPDALQFAETIIKKWARPIHRLDITRSGLRCMFEYGGQSYIPAPVVADVLPDLCNFARSFEALLARRVHGAASTGGDDTADGAPGRLHT
jgi:hypothetical protein